MTDDEERIIGTAIGKAFLSGAAWMLDAQHDDSMSVKSLDAKANDYAVPVMAQIAASLTTPSFGPLAAGDDVERVAAAILSCVTPDDEGDMPPVSELLGFSGENKTRMVGLAAARAAITAYLAAAGG